ncbi:MAG: HAMP domain-containing protein [Firmicutes bacterium]|nr:HAMP domain-containing protein [Bacillota bacterium]
MKILKWFYDLKIGAKLIAGFMVILFIVIIIILTGNQTSQVMHKYAENVTDLRLPSLQSLHTVKETQLLIAVSEKNLAQKSYSRTQRLKEYSVIESSLQKAEEAIQKYENFSKFQSKKIAKLWVEFNSQWAAWKNTNSQFLNSVRAADTINLQNSTGTNLPQGETIITSQDARSLAVFQSVQATLDQLIALTQKEVESEYSRALTANKNINQVRIFLLIIGFLTAIIIGFFFRNTITKPLHRVAEVIGEMSRGHLDQRLNLKRKDEIGVLAETTDNFVNDLRNNVVNPILKIAAGDLSYEVAPRDEGDEIGLALKKTMNALRGLFNDANELSQAVIAGDLDKRGDSERFQGVFKDIIDGVNQILNAISEPIQEATQILQEVAQGNLKTNMTGSYQGSHSLIKNAVNHTITALNSYIAEISKVLSEMSKGNLEIEITSDYMGDFCQIKDSFNLIIKSFNEILSELYSAAEQVSSGAKHVSNSSQTLNQAATEQASTIEEITVALNEIGAQTKQNAVNSNQANELAILAKDSAKQGSDQMNDLLKAIAEINEASSNISKIIKVIDEIAFQTNLLALNAAVEAARAGQHGRGFAVVADEIRNLAVRCANSAKEITTFIEASAKKVDTGTKIANSTAEALNKIVEGINRVTSLVGDIAVASNEQATGIAQINEGISQVTQVTLTNSAVSEETAAASQQLLTQANLLKGMVRQFKLKKAGSGGQRFFKNAGSEEGQDESLSNDDQDEAAAAADLFAEIKTKNPTISLDDTEFGKY